MSASPPADPAPAPSADPAPPTPSPRRWDWKPKVRWFAAEYLIVVLGVLTAVALNAWWQGRQDAASERTYLLQLQADLLETERLVAEADAVMAPVDADGARLVRAFFLPERPPVDSIVAWFSGASRVRDARPVMGTVEALIATGDLALLRNDSLRSAVTAYLDESRKTVRIHDGEVERWVDALLAFRRHLNPAALDEASPSPDRLDSLRQTPLWTLPVGDRRDPFPLDVESLLNDRGAYDEAKQMHLYKGTLRAMRAWMRRDARALREQVDAELNP
ncbi:MAG: hypothetical protein R3181_01070 [Rubricoccaceae bacterium]|nr:hypothetical protein [Rubricoccaceae bacterium]